MNYTKTMSFRYSITVKLFCIFAFTFGLASAQNKKPYLVIDGTKSPDGRYALAWGIPYTDLDVMNMVELIETDDYDAIRNFLVDLESEEAIATVGTTYFAVGGMVKNHGSLNACWRDDSRAVVIVEGGKWGYLSAEVIYIVNPEKKFGQCSDAIPLTISMRRAIRSKLLRDKPKESESINGFAISVDPQKWIDENQVLFSVIGEVPKSEDAFFYEGDIALRLAGPETVGTVESIKNIMLSGGIGGVMLEFTEAEVLTIAGKAGFGDVFKGKDEIWEAFGQAVQTWIFPEAGISLDMISDEIGGPKTVFSITVKAPSQQKTKLGIALGDSKADVLSAYAEFKTDSEEAEGFFEGRDVHLVGSIYGGMIFTFKDGQLSKIFLGVAAE